MRNARTIGGLLLLAITTRLHAQATGPTGPVARDFKAVADRIIDAALADSSGAWNTLARFTDYSGARLSGSPALERGI